MSLEELLDANKNALASGILHDDVKASIDSAPKKHWVIVTCMSCKLTDFIHKALGMKRGDAVFISNAGNTITVYDNSIIRSLAVAIYKLDVKEVAVIGHTNCSMKADVAPLTDSFARYGKSREMLKDVDLREWFGLIPNEEINVRHVVDAIKQSPVIPQEIPVYGLMIDSKTGELKEVYRYQGTMVSASKPIDMKTPQEIKPEKVQEMESVSAPSPKPAKPVDKNQPPPWEEEMFPSRDEIARKLADMAKRNKILDEARYKKGPTSSRLGEYERKIRDFRK